MKLIQEIASAFIRCLSLVVFAGAIGSNLTQAAVLTLNLNAYTDSARTSSFTTSGTYAERHDQWYLDALGLPSTLVRQGDVINATVTLDRSITLTVPPDASRLHFGLNLNSYSHYSDLIVGTTTTVNFLNQGTTVFLSPAPTTSGTVSMIPCSLLLFPEDGVSFTYDQVRFSTTVYSMTFPLTVNTAYLTYDIVTPVPEPGCLGLLCLSGLIVRGRKKRTRISKQSQSFQRS